MDKCIITDKINTDVDIVKNEISEILTNTKKDLCDYLVKNDNKKGYLCEYIIKRGKNKGFACGKSCGKNKKCNIHIKQEQINDNNKTEPEPVSSTIRLKDLLYNNKIYKTDGFNIYINQGDIWNLTGCVDNNVVRLNS